MADVPSWPSLYNPIIELFPLQHRDPIQPSGRYLHDPHDIFRFTLYWTFVFYTPTYVFCGIYAFLNLAFPPTRLSYKSGKTRWDWRGSETIPLRRFTERQLGTDTNAKSRLRAPRSPGRPNERRSRLTFALLVFVVFAVFGLAGAVVGSAVIGYVLAGLFKAATYNMSTWIPFIGGLLQTLVGFLGLWPTVIDII